MEGHEERYSPAQRVPDKGSPLNIKMIHEFLYEECLGHGRIASALWLVRIPVPLQVKGIDSMLHGQGIKIVSPGKD